MELLSAGCVAGAAGGVDAGAALLVVLPAAEVDGAELLLRDVVRLVTDLLLSELSLPKFSGRLMSTSAAMLASAPVAASIAVVSLVLKSSALTVSSTALVLPVTAFFPQPASAREVAARTRTRWRIRAAPWDK